MPVAAKCPGCGKEFKAADQFAGKQGKCPFCKKVFLLPSLGNEDDTDGTAVYSKDQVSSAAASQKDDNATGVYDKEKKPSSGTTVPKSDVVAPSGVEGVSVEAVCPHCQKKFKAQGRFAGKPGKCPFCKKVFTLPELPAAAAAPKSEVKSGAVAPAGEVIGAYTTKETLGRGERAVVYRARKKDAKKDVALKVFTTKISRDSAFVTQATEAVNKHVEFSHPNCVQIFEAVKTPKGFCYAMELVDQPQTLEAYLKSQKEHPPIEQTLRIVKEIAYGLEGLHHERLVHRDLNPENILLEKSGMVRLLEAATHKMPRFQASTGMTGNFVADPRYLSPEEATGDHDADERSDLYVLGLIFYRMATGKLPFSAATPTQWVLAQTSTQPKDPRQQNTSLPKQVAQVILKLLEKNPDKRYQSARELCEAIEPLEGKSADQIAAVKSAKELADAETRRQVEALNQARKKRAVMVGRLKMAGVLLLLMILSVIALSVWDRMKRQEFEEAMTVHVMRPAEQGKFCNAVKGLVARRAEYQKSKLADLFREKEVAVLKTWFSGNEAYLKAGSKDAKSRAEFFEKAFPLSVKSSAGISGAERPGFDDFCLYINEECADILATPLRSADLQKSIQLREDRIRRVQTILLKEIKDGFDPVYLEKMDEFFEESVNQTYAFCQKRLLEVQTTATQTLNTYQEFRKDFEALETDRNLADLSKDKQVEAVAALTKFATKYEKLHMGSVAEQMLKIVREKMTTIQETDKAFSRPSSRSFFFQACICW